jgi:hypothetical protein
LLLIAPYYVNQLHKGSQQNHNHEPNKNTQQENKTGISRLAPINQQDQLFKTINVQPTSASNLFISIEKILTHFLYQTTNYQTLIDQVVVDYYYWNDSIIRISICQVSSILQ